MKLDPIDLRLIDDWQRGFPLVPRPYAMLAQALEVSEDEVIGRFRRLIEAGVVSRIGPVFRPHVLGWSTLAAVAVPAERLDAVARLVSAYPEVNHNYEREHAYNLWFVVTASTRQRVSAVLAEIGRVAGTEPLDLPMLEDFHIDLGFRLRRTASDRRVPPHLHPAGPTADTETLRARLEPQDYALAAALEGGIGLERLPYAPLAAACGLSEAAFRARLRHLLELGVIRRFGVVVRHRELGYRANAMVVWDVPDARVSEVGRRLAEQPAVTLCYRRPRRPPHWPYNLFTMLHGRDRTAVLDELARLRRGLGFEDLDCHPLFSRRCFKQCGARYGVVERAA